MRQTGHFLERVHLRKPGTPRAAYATKCGRRGVTTSAPADVTCRRCATATVPAPAARPLADGWRCSEDLPHAHAGKRAHCADCGLLESARVHQLWKLVATTDPDEPEPPARPDVSCPVCGGDGVTCDCFDNDGVRKEG